MKHALLILLALALPLSARTPSRPVAIPTAPMARQRTVAEDNDLKAWISDIMTTGDDAIKHADAAEEDARESRAQTAIARSKQAETQTHIDEIQTALNAEKAARLKAESERDVEHRAKLAAEEKTRIAEQKQKAAEAHVSKIKTYLGFALGAFLALLAQYLPWGLLMPPWSLYGRAGGSVLAFGLGWLLVARFV